MRLAQYLGGRGQPEMAADVWVAASQAQRAISLYTQVCRLAPPAAAALPHVDAESSHASAHRA